MLGCREGAESAGQWRRHSKPGARGSRWDLAYRIVRQGPRGRQLVFTGASAGEGTGGPPFILSVMGSRGQEEVKRVRDLI